MTEVSKFHKSKIEPDIPKAKDVQKERQKQAAKHTIAQFCGRLSMRLVGDMPVLDLHGLRQHEAIQKVENVIQAILDDGRLKKIRIITGRGNHSEGVGVLAKEVHPHVLRVFAKHILDMSVSPSELVVRGFPGRGHFDVKFR
jgi:DNA-nicking Smr family endonuclease